jgi:hypothetical protein
MYSIFRSRNEPPSQRNAPYQPLFNKNPPEVVSIRAGYVTVEHAWGWAASSGPKIPNTITAEIPRVGHRSSKDAFVRVVVGRPQTSDTLARLVVGPLVEHWQWRQGTWVAELSSAEIAAEHGDTKNPAALLPWTRARLDEVPELTRLFDLCVHFTPEQGQALAQRHIAAEVVLDRLVQTLETHFAKTHPAIGFRIADHLKSPQVWLRLMNAPRVINRALETLLEGWPDTDAEARAIEMALSTPLVFGESQLRVLFEALDRRRDARLPATLTSLIADPGLRDRQVVLDWLEKRGDTTALAPLQALLARCANEWRDPIERAIAAIQFRTAEALNHTLGGLTMADEGGTLALSAPTPPGDSGPRND